MNWTRGLFRLWVVASILWAIGIALTAIGGWPAYSEHKYYAWNSATSEFKAVDWRDDYETEKSIAAGEVSAVDNPEGFTIVIAKDLQTNQAMKDAVLKVRASVASEYPLRIGSYLFAGAGFAIVPPILLLLIGMAIIWVARGFWRPAS
jgi:hypothetical protein